MAAPRSASRRRRRAAAVIGFLAALLGIVATQPLTAFSVLGYVFPGVLWRVETAEPFVALTFDDGPDPTFTPRVLEILASHEAHATFFLIAERALRRPDLVARIRAEGHEVGNHYVTRRSAWKDSNDQFAENLAYAGRVLGLDQDRRLLFRPPGGVARPAQLEHVRRAGYTVVLGSAYPYDPAPPPASFIRWLVTKNLAPGVIVILHDGVEDPSRGIEALPAILEAGRRGGFTFVGVGELMRIAELRGDRPRPRSPRRRHPTS